VPVLTLVPGRSGAHSSLQGCNTRRRTIQAALAGSRIARPGSRCSDFHTLRQTPSRACRRRRAMRAGRVRRWRARLARRAPTCDAGGRRHVLAASRPRRALRAQLRNWAWVPSQGRRPSRLYSQCRGAVATYGSAPQPLWARGAARAPFGRTLWQEVLIGRVALVALEPGDHALGADARSALGRLAGA